MQIGSKIYFELNSGNVIKKTEERQGDVVETTTEQDFENYRELSSYNQNAVGVLQLNFGDFADNFAKYPYHIDTSTHTIVWDTTNPIGASLADVQASKIAQLDDFCNKTILGGFSSSALGISHTYGFSEMDQANLTGELAMMNVDNTIVSVDWKTTDNGVLTHTKDQFIQVCKDGQAWKKSQIGKFWQLKAQVEAATSVDEVNAISW